MNTRQAFHLEKAVARLQMSDGEIMALAGEVAENKNLRSLADLTLCQSEQLMNLLEEIERGNVARKFRAAELATV